MILSDKSIKIVLDNEWVKIIPKPEAIQPASVDLKLGNEIKCLNGEEYDLSNDNIYVLKPHDFVLASTLEYVEIPNFLVGIVNGKSSLGRLGIMVHVTAGYIDPGFKGNITLELYNCSSENFQLKEGMNICQLILEELSTECENPYGSECLNSHYQDSKGTVYSRYEY